jgi:hypothetical protein
VHPNHVSSSRRWSRALLEVSNTRLHTHSFARFPDSFSRAITIWRAGWNRAIHPCQQQQRDAATAAATSVIPAAVTIADPTEPAWDVDLHTPTCVRPVCARTDNEMVHARALITRSPALQTVVCSISSCSDMESRQIEARLPAFVYTLLGSGIDFAPIAHGLHKPLRCLWMDHNIVVENMAIKNFIVSQRERTYWSDTCSTEPQLTMHCFVLAVGCSSVLTVHFAGAPAVFPRRVRNSWHRSTSRLELHSRRRRRRRQFDDGRQYSGFPHILLSAHSKELAQLG